MWTSSGLKIDAHLQEFSLDVAIRDVDSPSGLFPLVSHVMESRVRDQVEHRDHIIGAES